MANAAEIVKALEIIGKKVNLEKEWLVAEHDEIWFPGKPEDFSAEEIEEMDKLGITVDESIGTFHCYV